MNMHSADEQVSLRCAVLCQLSFPNSQCCFNLSRMLPLSRQLPRSHIHFSDLFNAHLKTMHGLSPNWPVIPWLMYVFRDVAVPPHKCRYEDLHQPSLPFTNLLAALYDRL